jgi:hypothetical protein
MAAKQASPVDARRMVFLRKAMDLIVVVGVIYPAPGCELQWPGVSKIRAVVPPGAATSASAPSPGP